MTKHVVAFVALVALAFLSFGLSFTGVPGSVALIIGAIKALIVLAVFMQLAVEPVSAALAFGLGVSLFLLLVFTVAGDVLTR